MYLFAIKKNTLVSLPWFKDRNIQNRFAWISGPVNVGVKTVVRVGNYSTLL